MDYKKLAEKLTRELDSGIKQGILDRQGLEDDVMGKGKTERIDREEERGDSYDLAREDMYGGGGVCED